MKVRDVLFWILFVSLWIWILVKLCYAQENITISIDNITLNVTVIGNYTQFWGEIMNITFFPPFDVDLGIVRCHFKPLETPRLEESHYRMICDFGWNITREQVYVPIPVTMLKAFEEIKGSETELAKKSGMLTFYQLWAIVMTIILVAYLLYSEWWVMRD